MINKLFAGVPRGCQTAPTNFITRRLGGAEMLWVRSQQQQGVVENCVGR